MASSTIIGVTSDPELTDGMWVSSTPWQDFNVTTFSVPVSVPSDNITGTSNISVTTVLPPSGYDSLLMTQFIMYGILGNILVALGLVGNTLSIVVLCNRRMRSSTSYYLTSLAVYDNFILVSMLLFFNIPALGYKEESFLTIHNSYMVIMPMGYPLSLVAQMGSIYTCVAFTVERFIAVCRPLHAANTCTKSRAKRAILLIFLWSVVYNIPRCFHYQAEVVWNNNTKQHETEVQVTHFGQNDLFKHIYLIYFQLIFMFLVPFLIIAVLNIALVKAIKRSRHQRQEMSTTATRDYNLTVMLVAVIVVFLLCQFPTIVDNILVAIVGEQQHGVVLRYQFLYTVSTFLVTINSSLNFMLYCLFGKKFRMVLVHILGMKKHSARNKDHYRSTTYQSKANGTKLTQCNTYDMELSLV